MDDRDAERATVRVFVVGCPRSGTTLMQSFLGAHPLLVTRVETHFFQTQPGPEAVAAWLAEMDASADGVAGWVEKTPGHIYELDRIVAAVPGARFVHVLRDPIEVVASLHWASSIRPAMWGGPYALDECIDRWRRAVRGTERWRGDPSHLVVEYQNLASDPEPVLRGTCTVLGLAFDHAMLDDRAALAPALGGALPWHDRLAGDVAYRGERHLSPEQRAYVEAATRS
ncbi:MAG: hypothetical protein QOF28_2889 [Actinomycetota bacterium]|jgi:hypothetical protein|nr:hypothetical protein [Actinomycetota bacterium]